MTASKGVWAIGCEDSQAALRSDLTATPGDILTRVNPRDGSDRSPQVPSPDPTTVTTSDALAQPPHADPADPIIDIVVPVHNEERNLDANLRRLRVYLDQAFPIAAIVTIVDNASTDLTWAAATRLASQVQGIRAIHVDQKGRGGALRAAWSQSTAPIVAYMDVDLATDLDALLPLVAPLLSGHSDLSIGSRLAMGARVVRGPKRELISRSYNLLLRGVLGIRFTDAQCGFKALRADTARALLPAIEDNEWFFDTELLVMAAHNGLRIHEVPVDWVDDSDSRVALAQTAVADLRGVLGLVRRLVRGRGRVELPVGIPDRRRPAELSRFAGIGVLSTAAYFALWLLLRTTLGALGANLVALAACTVVNTVVNGRLTFAARAPFRRRSQWIGGAGLFATSAVLTTAGLFVAGAVGTPSVLTDILVLLATNGMAAMVRFTLLRAWVFRTATREPIEESGSLGGQGR
jgi:glycosyltransferase involved in cell wall biosynthesis